MHIHMYICVCVCVCEGEGEGREGREVVLGGSVGRWVGEYVLVRVCVVLVFVSVCVLVFVSVVLVFVSLCWCFLKIPAIEQPYQVKRMIGGLRNVLFSTCSQTSNG